MKDSLFYIIQNVVIVAVITLDGITFVCLKK